MHARSEEARRRRQHEARCRGPLDKMATRLILRATPYTSRLRDDTLHLTRARGHDIIYIRQHAIETMMTLRALRQPGQEGLMISNEALNLSPGIAAEY